MDKEFSIQKFQRACRLHFISRWIWAYLNSKLASKNQSLGTSKLLIAGAVVGVAVLYSVKDKVGSQKE